MRKGITLDRDVHDVLPDQRYLSRPIKDGYRYVQIYAQKTYLLRECDKDIERNPHHGSD